MWFVGGHGITYKNGFLCSTKNEMEIIICAYGKENKRDDFIIGL